jgi:hypothetical protein
VRPAPALGWSAAHAPEERGRPESDVVQHCREQRVVLKAVPAAALVEELSLDVLQRNADPTAGLNRQVLEQKRFAMRDVQAP